MSNFVFKTPKEALKWAKENGPSDESRKMASTDPNTSIYYAYDVDKGPSTVTRDGVCQTPRSAYFYAMNIDECPCEQTRNVASKDPQWAFQYADYLDKKSHPVTWSGVAGTYMENLYVECRGMPDWCEGY